MKIMPHKNPFIWTFQHFHVMFGSSVFLIRTDNGFCKFFIWKEHSMNSIIISILTFYANRCGLLYLYFYFIFFQHILVNLELVVLWKVYDLLILKTATLLLAYKHIAIYQQTYTCIKLGRIFLAHFLDLYKEYDWLNYKL